MLKVKLPAYPLIVFDPLISVWSVGDKLYDCETTMWTGEPKPIGGHIIIDDEVKRFMGVRGSEKVIEQVGLECSMTATKYTFRDSQVELTVTFTSHFIPKIHSLTSRPTAFIDVAVKVIDGQSHSVEVVFDFSEKLTYSGSKKFTFGGTLPFPEGRIAYLGRFFQRYLESSGDQTSINWGWLYLGGQAKIFVSSESKKNKFFSKHTIREYKHALCKSIIATRGAKISEGKPLEFFLVPAYDDLYSILYFCEYKRGYWTTKNHDILEAIKDSTVRHDEIIAACRKLDDVLEAECIACQGENYAKLVIASMRQVFSSHKMIADGEDMLFLSKECGSNGCIGTVDVSYPSVPIFLIGAPEYVKGLLLPVFRQARLKNWTYDFAPHDVGRYPYASGQVYGRKKLQVIKNRILQFWQKQPCMQVGDDLYEYDRQMPIEESANMIIMAAAYFNATGEKGMIKENSDLLGKWAEYLVKAGISLENQLCTDDFAGHLPKNVNLAIKSIIAIAIWGKLLDKALGLDGGEFLKTAKEYAKELEKKSDLGDRLALTLDDRKSWSLKYNLVWDKLFKLDLFSEETYKKEIAFYKSRVNVYGIPLDSRSDVAKSDWEMWVAALDDSGELANIVCDALVKFLAETSDKVPFSDKYNAGSGRQDGQFKARTVQGAMLMLLYKSKLKEKGGFLLN